MGSVLTFHEPTYVVKMELLSVVLFSFFFLHVLYMPNMKLDWQIFEIVK